MRKTIALAFVAGSVLALGACKKEPPEELPPPPQGAEITTPTPSPAAPQGAAPGTQAHFAQQMAGRDTIYFDTDMFNIDAEDQAALAQQAAYLRQYPNIRATVEGHADERGTREYNLALGARRAAATRDFLVSRGVKASRLRTISYGKERPVAVCDDISCWSQNRRAVTVLNGAGS